MLQNFTVGIYVKTEGHQDSHGSWVPGEDQHIKDIDCDIQPYSQELLLKEYGYNIEVNKRIFVDYYEPLIKIGIILKYVNKRGETEVYEVKAIPWDDEYMEVACLELQEQSE
ncbi:MAG: hypothetical protein LKE46_00200 [Clostridium sp.]|jgi:hypothetical protein|uniref:hypothetical protein n=1 Tax=Clostridium sp. TaxID=1506 RepID=UPI0025BCAF8D|nr:hypothetical protein [Clostridium sp.]MCH3962688.1 hypothetical protein [Clostridium sp.]MCI2201073.1 hypothetical protein [Clostridium sp.]